MNSARSSRASTRGVALILVLACIVLLAALLVTYLVIASHAVRSAAVYKDGVLAQQLSDTAVNVVMGQIADGTHTAKEAQPEENLVWTSQPGLIRTYDTDGKPYRFYKLYSSADMVVRKFDNDYWSPAENVEKEVPDDWYEHRGLFTDLNEPALLPLDANTAEDPEGGILLNGRWHYANYPILDPAAQATVSVPGKNDGIEGFSIDAKRLSSALTGPPPAGYNPTLVTDPHRSPNPAPMPVRWLYVLRDGRLTVPESSVRGTNGSEEMHWKPGSPDAPTRENPIVGRIAFWADDETCKLNINTASEGTFWDRPYGTGPDKGPFVEKVLAESIPRSNEWQRTPGHPAMTCLSPVFGMLKDFCVPLTSDYVNADYQKFAAYYSFVPRLGKGGTEAGTRSNGSGQPPRPITANRDRLYASVDELLYTPKPNSLLREPLNTQVTRTFLEKAKFCLTTSNRAPETNVFNRPRISLWPVQQDPDPNKGKPGCPDHPRTAQDDRFVASTTLNKQPYFFQRYSVYMKGDIHDRRLHPDDPFPQQGDLKPPSSQRPDLDWKVERNQQLYRYLQDLTDRPMPGVPGQTKFSAKLGPDRDQLLTSMVDLLRTANDTSLTDESPAYSPYRENKLRYTPELFFPSHLGFGQVVPLIPPPGTPGAGTRGTGRFPTITEAAIAIYQLQPNQFSAAFAVAPFSPSAGPPTWQPLTRICIRGLDQFSIDGKNLMMPAVATNLFAPAYDLPPLGDPFLGLTGEYTFQTWDGNPTSINGIPVNIKKAGLGSEEKNYPFCSREPISHVAGNQLRFSGGKITIEIHAGYYGRPGSAIGAPPSESLIQTLELDFPPALVPTPSDTTATLDYEIYWGVIVYTVRSVQVDPAGPTGGDLRLLAAQEFVPANYFRPHPDYFKGYQDAHSMRNRWGEMYLWGGVERSEMIPGVPSPLAIAANGLRGAMLPKTNWQGDWNTGMGDQHEGAFYPHPDGGNFRNPKGGYSMLTGQQWFLPETGATYSPMREIPSPVIFGSLPVGVTPTNLKPWQTLLFCANPAAGKHHPGWNQPRDHYLLDFFYMPVVEPYALSVPLATAGKVNLNCQIAPFTYIQRDTALRGALRSTRVATVANVAGKRITKRLAIDADETLKGFQRRFADKGGCFKTASELCEMFLVPEGVKLEAMMDGDPNSWWWKEYRFTGDNLREGPYGHLYSRVTARSDTFTVHYRVQVLAHNTTAHPEIWSENTDAILREERGSTMIERYIDPDDPRLPDCAADPKAVLDDCYKFRTLRVQRFGR